MRVLLGLTTAWAAAVQPTVSAVHPERSAQIAEILEAGTTWDPRPHPRFAEHAPGASEYLLGVNGNSSERIRSAIQRGEIEAYRPEHKRPIPDAFDSAEAFPKCAKVIIRPVLSS